MDKEEIGFLKELIKTQLKRIPEKERQKVISRASHKVWIYLVFSKIGKHKRILNLLLIPLTPFLIILTVAEAYSVRKRMIKYFNTVMNNLQQFVAMNQNLRLINPEEERTEEKSETPVV